MRLALFALAVLTFSTPLAADEITPRLEAALAAQAAGDLKTLAAEVAAAGAAVDAERARRLEALLPEPPEGMTRTVSADYAAGLAMMGGGSGVEAVYSGADGSSATVTMNIDTPLIAGLMPTLLSPEMAAFLGEKVELGGLTFFDQDGSMTAIVDERLLVTVSGSDTETRRKLAGLLDGAALARFDMP